jgi:hypothetical protein
MLHQLASRAVRLPIKKLGTHPAVSQDRVQENYKRAERRGGRAHR